MTSLLTTRDSLRERWPLSADCIPPHFSLLITPRSGMPPPPCCCCRATQPLSMGMRGLVCIALLRESYRGLDAQHCHSGSAHTGNPRRKPWHLPLEVTAPSFQLLLLLLSPPPHPPCPFSDLTQQARAKELTVGNERERKEARSIGNIRDSSYSYSRFALNFF